MFEDFDSVTIDTGDAAIFARIGGSGPPVLFLHGFPQTHLMWRDVAPDLAQGFTCVCADLRGYGASSCPASTPDHATYAKRVMAFDMVALMDRLGFSRFAVVGHDRGGRVSYRLALDHPNCAAHLAVLDIVPTEDAWARADANLALDFWPWSLLAQPEPLPERFIAAAPDAIVDDAITGWGTAATAFPPDIRAAYIEALRDPVHAHAICEEYRAAAGIDREHDRADLAANRRIGCPTLALWSASGALGKWYTSEGGPLALWRRWCENVEGQGVEGGHFFPEKHPEQTARALRTFLRRHEPRSMS